MFIKVCTTDTQRVISPGFQLEEDNKITVTDVQRMIKSVKAITIGDKTTVVQVTLLNGFILTESSACVDPANYDQQVGADICMVKITDKIWFLLGFLLQSARNGFPF